jgi:hypothetical protein
MIIVNSAVVMMVTMTNFLNITLIMMIIRWPLAALSSSRPIGSEGAVIDYLQYAFSGVHISDRQLVFLEKR